MHDIRSLVGRHEHQLQIVCRDALKGPIEDRHKGEDIVCTMHRAMLRRTDDLLRKAPKRAILWEEILPKNHEDLKKYIPFTHMPDEIIDLAQSSQNMQHALLVSYIHKKLASKSYRSGSVPKHPTICPSDLEVEMDPIEAVLKVLASFDSWVHTTTMVRKPLTLHWDGEPGMVMPGGI